MSELPFSTEDLQELAVQASRSNTDVSLGAWEAIPHPTRSGWWAVVAGRHGDRLVAESPSEANARFIAAADPQAVRVLLSPETLERLVYPQRWVIGKGSVVLVCSDCGKTQELPKVGRDHVSIVEAEGWTAPPPRCPDCSKKAGLA